MRGVDEERFLSFEMHAYNDRGYNEDNVTQCVVLDTLQILEQNSYALPKKCLPIV